MAEDANSRSLSLGAIAAVVITVTFHRTRHLNQEAATSGLSPEQVAMVANHPGMFANDFPSGALESLKSIIFQIYPLMEAAGFDQTRVWSAVVFVEVLIFATAIAWSIHRIFPGSAWTTAAITTVLYCAGTLVTPDLARFQFPYYGWMYAFAYAGFLVVLAETIRENFKTAAVVLVVTFLIHPIVAVFTGAFAAAVLASKFWNGERPRLISLVAAGGIAIAGCGVWLAWLASKGTITAGAVDPNTYVALVRAQNYHWFPSFLGVYWELHHRHLLPLLSTLALIAWSVSAQPPAPRGVISGIVAGILTMLVICAVGLVIAEFIPVPLLLKLTLHRADTIALMAGGLLIVRALYRDLTNGDPIERGLAAYLLMLPLFADFGLAPLPVGLRIAYAAFKATRGTTWSLSLAVASSMVLILIGLFAFYFSAGLIKPAVIPAYTGLNSGIELAAAAVAALWLRDSGMPGLSFRAIGLLIALTAVAVVKAEKFDRFASPAARERGEDALQAQLWARANTSEGSLFMIDPGLGYMWRDKSHRPSFGTPREWLFISIMYNSRQDLLEEGMRRYRALGLTDPDYIYDPKNRRMPPLIKRIIGDAETRYYDFGLEDFQRLSEAYGIRYFVFRTDRLAGKTPLPEVYRNEHFVITAAP